MKAIIALTSCLALFCGGTDFAFAQNETASIKERLDSIQVSMNQMFMKTSEQIEALTTELGAVKQSLDHLGWFAEHVKQSVASMQIDNEVLLRNVTLLTLQSNTIAENQQYCANHEALKNLFFELRPRCGEFNPTPPPPPPPETVYSSCRNVPQQRSGVYRLAVNGSHDQTIEVYCEMDQFGGGWTVFQKRQDGSVDFNRTWSEYKRGFGSASGEYWLGLDKLHYLTSRDQHDLLIILENFSGITTFAQYSGMTVDNENNKYKLLLNGNGSGSAGDSLYVYRGENFVTYDVQSSPYLGCAKELGSGFWHYGCDTVQDRNNLNGIYGTTARRQGIWWSTFTDGVQYNPLKRVQMMIREKFN